MIGTLKSMKKILTLAALFLCITSLAQTERSERLLKEWEFRKGHDIEATEGWKMVNVPHD